MRAAGSEEFALPLPRGSGIAADHGEGVVFRAEAPLASLNFNIRSASGETARCQCRPG